MTCSYTDFESIGIMTFEQAGWYVDHMEEILDENAELKFQCNETTKNGLLVKEDRTQIYHWLCLK